MRFPRHAERQGIAPESKFAEKKTQTGPREACAISEIENCQTCPAFRKGDRIKLGLPGLLQLKAWHSWASKEVVGSSIFSISIQIFMHFVFMLFHITTNKIQPQIIKFKPRPTNLDHPMEPPLFRSNADEANAAAPSFHKELEELSFNFILTLV